MTVNRTTLKAQGIVLLFLISLVFWSPPAHAAEDIGNPVLLQAQDINATFDPISEETVVTWRNINSSENPDLFSELWDATYHVYRHEQPLNSTSIAALTPFISVGACDPLSLIHI